MSSDITTSGAVGSVAPELEQRLDEATQQTSLLEAPEIPIEAAREIDNFEQELRRFERGELAPERFRAFRLAHGVYGQRQPGVQMIRVKIPAGAVSGRQLGRLADIAESFSATRLAHLTTRQDVQFHHVPMAHVPQVLRLLAEVGLTTREACGNSVRNVTACPLTGFIADELFDVQPYAQATYAYLVRNAFCQQMARKFKIAFSSCPEDCAATAIHDIGFVGRIEGNEVDGRARLGFRVLVGGGLGSTPFTAKVLADFVPIEDLLVTLKGILLVYSELGNRKNKTKARLKFVVHALGIEELRRRVDAAIAALSPQERDEAKLGRFVPASAALAVAEHLAGIVGHEARVPRARASDAGVRACSANGARDAFDRWEAANVREHVDPSKAVVTIALPLGDVDASRLRRLARLVSLHGDRARIAIHQNLVLPDVDRARLRELHDALVAEDLGEASIGTALDVTSCPGADTCAIGITSSKGVARAIRSELLPLADSPDGGLLAGITIKVSGCPNSCGQHHVANIGLHGVAKSAGGRKVPAYQLHLGGRIGAGDAAIGRPLDKIPARNVPRAITAVLRLYESERRDGESFAEFAARVPKDVVSRTLAPFANDVSAADVVVDWGQEEAFTTDDIGTGECAGAGTDAASDPFDAVIVELHQARLFIDRGQWVDALANINRNQYTVARALLGALGKNPDSDYETVSELRAQVIDRGHASERWNELHEGVTEALRARTPDPDAVRSLHADASALLDEARNVLPRLQAKRALAAEVPG